jgi:hypothetical protein
VAEKITVRPHPSPLRYAHVSTNRKRKVTNRELAGDHIGALRPSPRLHFPFSPPSPLLLRLASAAVPRGILASGAQSRASGAKQRWERELGGSGKIWEGLSA